jgi:hypothetical protein
MLISRLANYVEPACLCNSPSLSTHSHLNGDTLSISAQPKLLCIAHTKTTPTDSQLNALISLTLDWMLLWSNPRQPGPNATVVTPCQFSSQPKLLFIVHTKTTPTDSQLNALISLTPDWMLHHPHQNNPD